MTDDQFVAAFETCTIRNEEFHPSFITKRSHGRSCCWSGNA